MGYVAVEVEWKIEGVKRGSMLEEKLKGILLEAQNMFVDAVNPKLEEWNNEYDKKKNKSQSIYNDFLKNKAQPIADWLSVYFLNYRFEVRPECMTLKAIHKSLPITITYDWTENVRIL